MMLKYSLGFALVGLLAACTGGVSLGTANGPLGAGDLQDGGRADASGNPASGPYDVACTFYHRPTATAEFEEQYFNARSDQAAQKTITFSSYTFDIDLGQAADAPTDSVLSVKARDVDVVQQYRLAKNARPVDQFAGGHGFTGLVYLAQEMQYVCSTPGASVATSQSDVAPIDIACQVELRTTPGGAIEKSEVLEFTSGGTKSFTEGDYNVKATIFDDAFEGRGMFVDMWKGPATSTTYATHQLLQINRNAATINQLAGTTFTGRFALGTGTNKELSYACSSRATGSGSGGATAECGPGKPTCANGATCATTPTDSTPRCYANPCSICGGAECMILESYPAQIRCGK